MPEAKPGESHTARITAEMRALILEGHWVPGQQLASESDLAQIHGVSRLTIGRALTRLAAEGYLLRRGRGGTVVARRPGRAAVIEIRDIEQEVAGLGLAYGWRLLARDSRPLREAERRLLDLGSAAGGDCGAYCGAVLVLEGVHLAQGAPFCLETRVIDTTILPDAAQADFAATAPGQWLAQHLSFGPASHRLRAVNAMGRDARLLDIAFGAACLEILRETQVVTRAEAHSLTRARLLYPGERHQLVAEATPGAGPAALPQEA